MQEQQNNDYNNNYAQDDYLSRVQQDSQISRDANAQRRNAGLERKNNGSQSKSSGGRRTPSSKNQRNIDNNEQNLRNAADVAIATNNPYGVAAGKAFKAADKITGGRSTKALAKAINTANKTSMAARLTQKALNRMNESGMGDKLGKAARAKNKFSGDKNISNDKKASDSSHNDNEQQQSEEIESNGGSIDLFAKIKKYKWPIIVAISFFSITFYLCIMMATIADGTAAAGAFSNEATNSGSENDWDKTAEDRINTNDEDKTDNDVEGGIIEESYLNDNILSSVKFVAKEKLFNSDDIADYYGVEIACGGNKSKKCTTGTEYKFYLKMYDIYFLYKNQYGVSLDLPLIMATLNYGNEQMPVVFNKNLNDYNRNDVKSDIYQGDLSWEFDYKNLAGYTYLNANDFRYDMQILAKNMVTKKISYKCGDISKEAKDIETSKYSSELKCDSGTYDADSVTETYELDLDKYDEFLLEYIEHKYFMKGTEIEQSINGDFNSTIFVTGEGSLSIEKFNQNINTSSVTPGIELTSEPSPNTAIKYWSSSKGISDKDFVYPLDKATGLPLGAWPKNYKNIPTQLSNCKMYQKYYIWPTTPENGVYRFVYEHTSVDIMAKFGTPVYSPVDGSLVYSEWGGTPNKGSDETSYSITITPDHVVNYNGVAINEIFLTHMSGIRYRCSWGKCNRKVRAGELLGFVGNAAGTSKAVGWAPHLHMTLYNKSNYSGGLKTSALQQFYSISSGNKREVCQ